MESSVVSTRLITNANHLFILGSKDLDVRKIQISSLTAKTTSLKPVGTGMQDINGDSYFDLVLRFENIPPNASVEISGSLYDGTRFTASANPSSRQTNAINPNPTPSTTTQQPFPQRKRGGCCFKRL